MIKLLRLLLLFIFLCSSVYGQRFVGINNGNYAGITGVMMQPASIIDSRYKFDINLFSTDVRYSNNYFLLNRDVLLKFNKNNFGSYSNFRSKYLSEAQLAAGEKAFFNISNRTQLPLSFMVSLNEKSALALNLQSRTMVQARNISQDLAKLAFNNFYFQPLNNRSIDASGLTLRSLNWAEIGLTYGYVLFNEGNHFLKGAITGKYLAGVSSLNLSANNFTAQVNSDSTFNFNADRVTYNHNKNADFNRVFDRRFKPDANAFGFDAGLVYEFRGHLNNFKYIRNDDEESYEVNRRDLNKYIFKFGVSLLDGGMFTFAKPENANSFSANINNWDIRNTDYGSLKDFDTALARRVTPLANNPRQYNVYLPGALSVQMDIRFIKGLYLNAVAYRPLKLGNEPGSRFDNYGFYSITPRFEKRHFGLYLPYTFSDRSSIADIRDNQLGLAMKLGPVFFGSSNLGSMAFNKRLKAADFFVGLKIGFTYGKPSGLSKLFTPKKQQPVRNMAVENYNEQLDNGSVTKVRPKAESNNQVYPDTANRLVVDYMKGQVYNNGKNGPVIIVNNHYYYGNQGANGRDSTYNQRMIPGTTIQGNNMTDSLVRISQAQKSRTDSANRVLRDSLSQKRQQLDTLINRLNNLRQRIDSTNRTDSLKGAYLHRNNLNREVRQDTTTSLANNNRQRTNDTNNLAFTTDTVYLNNDQRTNTDSSKKKVLSADVVAKQNRVVKTNRAAQTTPDRNAAIAANNRWVQQQSDDNAYNDYIRQSQRLQNDIEQLERQMAYNRRVTYPAPPVRYSNPVIVQPQPQYYNTIPVPVSANPVITPVAQQSMANNTIVHDTIRIHDTVFVTKTDTITQMVKDTPTTVYVPVEKTKVVKETFDYDKLPAENILFASGEASIRQVYFKKLNYLAALMRNNPGLRLSITGHTDVTGSPAVNEKLSYERARRVKAYFLNKGLAEARMQLSAVAAADPLVKGNTTNAKSQNRRVEIRVVQ